MTLLTGSSTAEIDAPIEHCWELVASLENAPRWQNGLESVDVVKRDDQGRAVVCDTLNDAKVAKVHCRVRIDYDPPHRVTFTRMQSDDVDELEGSWELEELPGGRTRATYSLAVDPGPVPRLARPLVNALKPKLVGDRAKELARAVAAGM